MSLSGAANRLRPAPYAQVVFLAIIAIAGLTLVALMSYSTNLLTFAVYDIAFGIDHRDPSSATRGLFLTLFGLRASHRVASDS